MQLNSQIKFNGPANLSTNQYQPKAETGSFERAHAKTNTQTSSVSYSPAKSLSQPLWVARTILRRCRDRGSEFRIHPVAHKIRNLRLAGTAFARFHVQRQGVRPALTPQSSRPPTPRGTVGYDALATSGEGTHSWHQAHAPWGEAARPRATRPPPGPQPPPPPALCRFTHAGGPSLPRSLE